MTKVLKKLSAAGMALILAFSVTACSGGDDGTAKKERSAKEILESNLKKSNDLKDVDMSVNMKYVVDTGTGDEDSEQSMDMSYDTQIADSGNDSMKMAMKAKVGISGVNVDMEAYYTDGYYYTNILNQKAKQAMDLSKIQEQMESSGDIQLPIDNYTDLKAKTDSDGNTVISYALSEDGLNEYILKFYEQLSSLSGSSSSVSSEDLEEIKVSSFTGTRTVNKDDYTVKDSIEYIMESAEGEEGKITVSMDIEYNNPGEKVSVTLPDDLSDYQESTTAGSSSSNLLQ